MIKAIIFDIGGVLVENSNVPILQQIADQYNLDFASVQEVIFANSEQLALGGITEIEILNKLAQKFNLPETGSDIYNKVTGVYYPIDAVWEYVGQLKGRYHLAVLSNMGLDGIDTHEEQYGLAEHFEKVFYSASLGMKKPNPAFYQKLVDELGVVAGECVFVDDMQRNVDVATRLGMQGILYTDPSQLKTDLLAAGVVL